MSRPTLSSASGAQRKLLVITNWRDLDHPDAGGAEVVCQELAARFAAQGHGVVLLCAAVKGRPRHELHDGYRIVRAGGTLTVYAHALLWLLRHRRRVGAVIDSQNGIPFFTPLAVSARTPVLMLLHHVHQDQFAGYFSPPMAALGRWLESTASRAVYGRRGIVTVSPSTRTGARRRLGLRGDIWVAPPGCSVTPIPDARRTVYPSVVCVGRLVPHKRTDLVIRAFPAVLRRRPDARLTIVGRGPDAAKLAELARELHLAESVSFRADLDDAQRDQMLATAWMSVNASQGEGWGLSVIEANALGTPVLAYRRPGLRDSIVAGETGWLIDDAEDLGSTITGCLDELVDPDRAGELSRNARTWSERFTWESMTTKVDAALRSERARLSLGVGDRRARSDVATVVTLPMELLPCDWHTRVRDTDVWDATDEAVTLLCRGADTQTVRELLGRLGIDRDLPLAADVSMAVARNSDLLRLRPAAQSEHV